MSYYSRMSRNVVVGVPLAALLVGGAGGWLTRDQTRSTRATHTAAVGAPLPEQMDTAVPFTSLPTRFVSQIIDPATIIGLTAARTINVPRG
ncbi:MAG: hypothetical protein WCK21_04340, partial [Actinomycetota bacterium]